MPPAMSAEVLMRPSAWLLTRMLLAAALEQSAVGMASPTISGRRAMRDRRPISRASAMCQRRASISPPRNDARPTMANRRPNVLSFMKIFSASEAWAVRVPWDRASPALRAVGASGAAGLTSGAARRASGVACGAGPALREADAPEGSGASACASRAAETGGAARIRRLSAGMCRMSQHDPATARANQSRRLGRFHGGGGVRRFIAF